MMLNRGKPHLPRLPSSLIARSTHRIALFLMRSSLP